MTWREAVAPSLIVALACLAGCAKDFAYQNTRWGMSERAVESARPSSQASTGAAGERSRIEHATINGLKATVAYRFAPNGLQSVAIVFDPVSVEKAVYVDHYRQIKELLIEKYGQPEVDTAAMAAMSGKYRIPERTHDQAQCSWRMPLAMIRLSCGGNCDGSSNGESISISYEQPTSGTEGL